MAHEASKHTPRHLKRSAPMKSGQLTLAMLPAILAFVLLTALAWALPLRPVTSEEERRNLTPFPDFSLSSLADGSFFDGVNLWFSDTFPLRERWIHLANTVEDLHGRSEIMVYGDLGQSDPIPAIPAPVTPEEREELQEETSLQAPTAEPEGPNTAEATEPTVTEPREEPEAQTPEEGAGAAEASRPSGPEDADPPAEGVDSASKGEAEVTEPGEETPEGEEPGPEAPEEGDGAWHGTVLNDDDYFASGAVIQINNAAYNVPGFSENYAKILAQSLNKGADVLEGINPDAGLYLIMAPSNITFSLSRSDREYMGLVLQEDGLLYQESLLDPRVHFVKVFDKLTQHSGEYLAFRTDHHWTALGAYYAYEAWCEEKGVEPVPLSDYTELEFPGYRGTTYSKARRSSLLEADTVYAYVPPGDVHLYIGEGDGLGVEYPLHADETHSNAGVKYSTFLWGDQPKCVLVNNDITDGSSCLILKNSIGNPLPYYYTQHYQYTYVLDLRYYWTRRMTGFTTKFEIDDVIFCFGADFGWGKGGNELVGSFCR